MGAPPVTAGPNVLPPQDQRVVGIFEHIAASLDRPLAAGSRVLDFGAGAGRHVAEFRDAGYDALGIDHQYSSHAEGSVQEEFLRMVEPPHYLLPFERDEFDFVYSTSVMEHVVEPGTALQEISRVLRPGGLSVHVFPARWRPLEPHMLIPLGGRFQSYWIMRLWAAVGMRNGFQCGLPAERVALSNVQYSKTGINYPTAREWILLAKPWFVRVGWAEASFVLGSRSVSRVSQAVAPLIRLPGAERTYRGLHTRVLVLHG